MTLSQFQTQLAELISQPERLGAVRALGNAALGTADLDGRERRRLIALAHDPRLEVAVMLHLRRRLAAVLTALPQTSRLLGDTVISSLMREYRRTHQPRSNYFAEEGLEFAVFLKPREELTPFVADVLALEVAVLEIHLEEERKPESTLLPTVASLSPSAHPRLAPRSRLIDTHHDPEQLAAALRGGLPPPDPMRQTETILLKQAKAGEVDVEVLERHLASVLRLCTGRETIRSLCASQGLGSDDFAALNEGGYIVLSRS